MGKILLAMLFLVMSANAIFAQKYLTRTGKIYFSAIVPATPEVEATNNEVAIIIDAKTGEIVCQVPVKSFKFQRELMQEHFNENYMESDKYPKSEFKGTITNLNSVNFTKDGTYNATVRGNITIHGVTHEVTVTGTITVKGSTLELKAKFSVKLKDFNITIPNIVADKVAQEATIILTSDLSPR